MKFARSALLASCLFSAPVLAGPPFDTDDPEPTDVGHVEAYFANYLDGAGDTFQGEVEAEINYGAAKDIQLTVALPIDYAHDGQNSSGLGDVELAAKYRFIHIERAGFSVAAFPNVTLPTGTNGFGDGHVTALIPFWAQKEFGAWTLFGGGGFAINPGVGNLDHWTGGFALTRDVSNRLNIGMEATREGPTFIGDRPTNTLGFGMICKLEAPFSLLLRGGPSWEDGGKAAYHLYTAIGLNF